MHVKTKDYTFLIDIFISLYYLQMNELIFQMES